MAQAHKLVIVLAVLPEAAQGDGHAVFQVPVQAGLGAVRLFEVVEELFGSGGELQFLGGTPESGPVGFDLVHGGLFAFLELHEHRRHVAVLAGHPEALGGNGRPLGSDDLAALHAAPEFQGLPFALLLLTADVGNAVVHHLRPAFERFARAGDGLVSTDQGLFHTVLQQGMQGGNVALEGAVALHGDEAPLGAQALALGLNDFNVLRIQLRHHHRHVVRPAVGGVVGDDGALQLGVPLLQGPDILLLHVHGAEAEVHLGGQFLRVGFRVQDDQALGFIRHGRGHGPAGGRGFLVGFPGAPGAGGYRRQLEPGVVLQKRDETLAHHTGASNDAGLVLFHSMLLPPRWCLDALGFPG